MPRKSSRRVKSVKKSKMRRKSISKRKTKRKIKTNKKSIKKKKINKKPKYMKGRGVFLSGNFCDRIKNYYYFLNNNNLSYFCFYIDNIYKKYFKIKLSRELNRNKYKNKIIDVLYNTNIYESMFEFNINISNIEDKIKVIFILLEYLFEKETRQINYVFGITNKIGQEQNTLYNYRNQIIMGLIEKYYLENKLKDNKKLELIKKFITN